MTITDALSCVASSSIFVDSTYIDVTTQAYSRCNDSAGVIVLSTNGVQVNIITWLDNNLNPIRILSDTVSYLPVTTDTLFGLSRNILLSSSKKWLFSRQSNSSNQWS